MTGTQTAAKIQDKEKLAQWLVDLTQNCPICKSISQIVQNWKKDILLHIQRGTKASTGSKSFHISNGRQKWKKSHGKRNQKKNIHICLSQLWLTNLLQIWIPTNVHKDRRRRRRRRGLFFKSSSEIGRMELKKSTKKEHTHTHTHTSKEFIQKQSTHKTISPKKIPSQLL
jgi:hypothetical protein